MRDIIVESLKHYNLKSDTLLFIGHRVEDPYKINYNIWKCYYGDIENDVFIGIIDNNIQRLEKERMNFETSYILCFNEDIETKCKNIEYFYKTHIEPLKFFYFSLNKKYSILDLILKNDFDALKTYNVKCILMLSNNESWVRIIEL